MSDANEATTSALIAVDAMVGTLHLAHAVTEDPAAAEALRTALMSALTARTLLEAAVEGDPVKEPQKDPYATMGQAGEEEPITLGPDPDCEHEDLIHWEDGGKLCRACGQDEWPDADH